MRLYALALILLIVFIPIQVPQDTNAPAPRLHQTIAYTGSSRDSYTNSTVAFNLSVTITSFSYDPDHDTILYNLTYSLAYEGYNGTDYYDNEDLYSMPIRAPAYSEEVPVALYPGFLGDFLNVYLSYLITEGEYVRAEIEGYNVTLVYHGYDRNETIIVDVTSGVVVHYKITTDSSRTEVRALSYPHETITVNYREMSGVYERAYQSTCSQMSIAISFDGSYEFGELKLYSYDLYAFYNDTLISTHFVSGRSPESPEAYSIFLLRYDYSASEIQDPHNVTIFIDDEPTVATFGKMNVFGMFSLYVGISPEGPLVAMYNPYTFAIFLTYAGDSMPAMSSASFEGSSSGVKAIIRSTDHDAIVDVYHDSELINSYTIGSGIVLNITQMSVIRVHNDTGGTLFYVVTSPIDHNFPTIDVRYNDGELSFIVYDNEPIVHYEISESGSLVASGYTMTFMENYFHVSGDVEITIVDLNGNSVSRSSSGGSTNNSAPSIACSHSVDGNNVTIHVTVTDDDSSFIMLVYVDGSLVMNETIGNDYTFSLELSDGEHTIKIDVIDPAGNSDSCTFTVSIAEESGSSGSEEASGKFNTTVLIGVLALIVALVAIIFLLRRRRKTIFPSIRLFNSVIVPIGILLPSFSR